MMTNVFLSSRSPMRWLARRLVLAAAAAALADWLFSERGLGLSLAVFLSACGALAIIANPVRAQMRLRIVAAGAFILSLLAIVEDGSWLSFLVAGGGTLLFAQIMTTGDAAGWPRQLRHASRQPFVGPFLLLGDVLRARRLSRMRRRPRWRAAALIGWVTPIGMFLLFLSLFATANPLIDEWVRVMDPRRMFDLVSPWRAAFWLAIACLTWPLLHWRVPRGPQRRAPSSTRLRGGDDALLGKDAVMRSLIACNLLFALQTSLDAAYLWGGLTLPDGLTYAEYAHRGAYPLLATALLAAGFALVAMRADGPAETASIIKPLVLVFVAQNVMLVLSSIFRTSFYVAAYSLTELRLVAMIWMGLVGVGLILIVVRIARRKSTKWLLDANALAAAVTLYLCCFVNFPSVVATYNVAQFEASDAKGPLDLDYLLSLGPQAIPAYDRYLRFVAEHPDRRKASSARECWARASARDAVTYIDWRGWTFRDWRLKRYFDTYPDAPPASGGASCNP